MIINAPDSYSGNQKLFQVQQTHDLVGCDVRSWDAYHFHVARLRISTVGESKASYVGLFIQARVGEWMTVYDDSRLCSSVQLQTVRSHDWFSSFFTIQMRIFFKQHCDRRSSKDQLARWITSVPIVPPKYVVHFEVSAGKNATAFFL